MAKKRAISTSILAYALLYLALLVTIAYMLGSAGAIFAIIDVGTLPLFVAAGFDLESRIGNAFKIKDSGGLIGAMAGSGVGNEITDIAGAALDPTMHATIPGIVIFGTLALGVIYIIYRGMQGDDRHGQTEQESDASGIRSDREAKPSKAR